MPPTLGARSGRVRGVSGVCVWLLFIFEDSWAHMGSSCGIVLLKVWHFPESDDPFNYSHHSGACAAAGFFLRREVRTPTPGTGAVYLAVLSHIHYRAYLQNETRISMGRSWSRSKLKN